MPRGNIPRQPSKAGRHDKAKTTRVADETAEDSLRRKRPRRRKPHQPTREGLQPPRPRAHRRHPATPRRALSQREVRAAPQQRMGAAGGDHPLRAMHRRARQHGHAHPVQEISDARSTSPRCNPKSSSPTSAPPASSATSRSPSSEPPARSSATSAAKSRTPWKNLLTVPGAARKTANVVLGSWFGIAAGVVVDTHVQRISRRLELTKNEDPPKIEQDLMRVIPREQVDRLLPPDHPSRPRHLHRAQAQVRRVSARRPLPRRRQNLVHGRDSQERETVTNPGSDQWPALWLNVAGALRV